MRKYDLLAAASVGFKMIYVTRTTEDSREVRERMRSKKDGEMRTNRSYYTAQIQFVVVGGNSMRELSLRVLREACDVFAKTLLQNYNASLDDHDSFGNISIALHSHCLILCEVSSSGLGGPTFQAYLPLQYLPSAAR
ncbi:hypothetical protein BDR07DRAFT_1380159 [Suillus spraguei]|nr:hypothetical protein BDR07DRAFT_1380159 [Suillus spraguei]